MTFLSNEKRIEGNLKVHRVSPSSYFDEKYHGRIIFWKLYDNQYDCMIFDIRVLFRIILKVDMKIDNYIFIKWLSSAYNNHSIATKDKKEISKTQ